jgi:hypothetical protein
VGCESSLLGKVEYTLGSVDGSACLASAVRATAVIDTSAAMLIKAGVIEERELTIRTVAPPD